jgi:ABC-type nitrate/sulfonate/bicarbonate transport system substrate-binding protein
LALLASPARQPLIMDPLGLYKKEGLNVTLKKTAGWA